MWARLSSKLGCCLGTNTVSTHTSRLSRARLSSNLPGKMLGSSAGLWDVAIYHHVKNISTSTWPLCHLVVPSGTEVSSKGILLKISFLPEQSNWLKSIWWVFFPPYFFCSFKSCPASQPKHIGNKHLTGKSLSCGPQQRVALSPPLHPERCVALMQPSPGEQSHWTLAEILLNLHPVVSPFKDLILLTRSFSSSGRPTS